MLNQEADMAMMEAKVLEDAEGMHSTVEEAKSVSVSVKMKDVKLHEQGACHAD